MASSTYDIKPCDGGVSDFKLLELPYTWQLDEGVFQYAGVPSVIFWAPTSLAAFLEGMYRIAGPERYGYILQAQGRLSEQDDWNYICSFPTFLEGLRGINRVAVTAGWGLMELIHYEPEQKQATMRIYNAWEALCQKALGVCWGSHYFAGKLAGWFSRHFGVNCWCTQVRFSAQGHAYDEFLVAPSPVTVEAELVRIDEEERRRTADLDAQERQRELTAVVEQRTKELRITIERLEQAQAVLQKQAETIQQLSIPIVQVWDGILLVSLIGHLDGQRAQHLIELLLESIRQRRARMVLLDVTGVTIVDTAVAGYLMRTVQAVKLLGAQTMLVGISPEIAQTLVTLEVDLGSMVAAADLQQGLQMAMAKIGLSVQSAKKP